MTLELDGLDNLAAASFDGYLVRKDLVRKYSRQYPVPTYVVEFLLGRYCASVDEAEINEGLQIVEKQLTAGLAIINDGEMSKPSYATYVKDRLHGFGGSSIENYFFADLAAYPKSAELVAANPGRRKRHAPACNGPISVKEPEAADVDMLNLNAAVKKAALSARLASPAGLFSSARASLGVICAVWIARAKPSMRLLKSPRISPSRLCST